MRFKKEISSCLVILLMFLLLNCVEVAPAHAESESWLTGWSYRRSHVIQKALGAGTNYQVPIVVGYYGSGNSTVGVWSSKQDLPVDRADLPAVVYEGLLYVFGGYGDDPNDLRSEAYAYDPSNDVWVQRASMTYARWGSTAALYDGVVYVFGGIDGSSNSKVEAYTVSNDSWVTKNDLPADISVIPSGGMAVKVGSLIYIFSGVYAYSYDPSTDSYSQLAAIPVYRTWGTCAYVNVGGEDRIYIIGGFGYDDGSAGATGTVYYYRPAYDDWSYVGAAPYAAWGTTRDNPVIDGKIYYGMGHTGVEFFNDLYCYDPLTDTWSDPLASAAHPRDGVACGVVNDCLYVVGGRDTTSQPVHGLSYNEKFDPTGVDGKYVNAGGKCRTDFGDVRFTANDGVTELSYWLQEKVDGDHAVFWVELTDDLSIANSTIYVYYGNYGASTTSDGADTWLLFDDFESADPLVSYSADLGSKSDFEVTPVGSFGNALHYEGSVDWYAIYRTFDSYQNFRMFSMVRPDVESGNYYAGVTFRRTDFDNWYFAWLANDNDGYAGSPWGPRVDWNRRISGSDTYIDGGSTDALQNIWATLEVDISDAHGKVYVDGALKADINDSAISSAGAVGFVGLYPAYWDNLCVGKYVYPEPIHGSWGIEEVSTEVLACSVYLVVTLDSSQADITRGQSATVIVNVFNRLDPVSESSLTLTVTGPGNYGYFDVQPIRVPAGTVGEYSFSWFVPDVAGTYVVEVELVPLRLTAYDAVWLAVD